MLVKIVKGVCVVDLFFFLYVIDNLFDLSVKVSDWLLFILRNNFFICRDFVC